METSYFNLIVTIGLTGEQEEEEGQLTARLFVPVIVTIVITITHPLWQNAPA